MSGRRSSRPIHRRPSDGTLRAQPRPGDRRLVGALLLGAVLATTACEAETGPISPADAGPGGQPDATRPDSGPSPTPDAGALPDAEPAVDAGPARRFVERRLFGEGSVENLVFDPTFELSSYAWYAITASGFELIPIERHFLTWSPTGEPAIRVPKERFSRGAFVLGSSASESGALAVSVWTGRPIGLTTPEDIATGTLVTVGARGPEIAVDLVPDEATRVERDGISWVRSSVVLEDALGVLSLLIGDSGNVPFWVTAPSVLPARSNLRGGHAGPPAITRAATATELRLIGVAAAAKRASGDPRKAPSLRRTHPR